MANLTNLKKSILADGKIDAAEVAEIKKVIYEDGKIDSAEANFLFALNDGCSGAKNHSSWATLFVDAICSYLLEDEKSPGEVDKKEADDDKKKGAKPAEKKPEEEQKAPNRKYDESDLFNSIESVCLFDDD